MLVIESYNIVFDDDDDDDDGGDDYNTSCYIANVPRSDALYLSGKNNNSEQLICI